MEHFSKEEPQIYKSRADFLMAYGHQPLLFIKIREESQRIELLHLNANAPLLHALGLQTLPDHFIDDHLTVQEWKHLLKLMGKLSPDHREIHQLTLSIRKGTIWKKFVSSLIFLHHEQCDTAVCKEIVLKLEVSTNEESTAVSSVQLQNALKNSHILAVSVNHIGGITYVNHAMEEALEEDAYKLMGRNLFDEFTPLRGKKLTMRSFLDLAAQQDIHENLKRTIETKSGKLIKLNLTGIVYHESDTELKGMTILAENITEQKEVKRDLQEKNRQLAELFKTSYDLIQIFTETGDLLFVNQSWKDKLGYQEYEHLNFFDLVHPHYLHKTIAYLDNLKRGKESSSKFQTVLLSRLGHKVYIAGSISARLSGKSLVEFRGIFHDISEQVRAERAQNLYNSIANLAIHSPDLDALFFNIHRELRKVLQADHFYVALLDDEMTIRFPYKTRGGKKQKQDTDSVYLAEKSLVDYVLTNNKAAIYDEAGLIDLAADGIITPFDQYPQVWLGVPLSIKDKHIGLLSIQHDESLEALTRRDLDLLDFVSGQVALAIDRKLNEEKLNEQTSRLNAIFESSTHLIWSVDKDFRLTSFNRNFGEISLKRYGLEPVIGEVFNEQEQSISRKYMKDWKKSYELAAAGFPSVFEIEFVGEEEGKSWYQVFVNPVYREDGTIREISGIAHDITERKESELALLESEEKFRTIFQSFQDIYFRCRLDGTITLISPSLQELTDYETYEVVGKNITNYYLYDGRTKNLIRQLVKNKQVRNFEATVIKANGDLMPSICNVRLIYNLARKPVEIEGTIRDITQLKKTTLDLQRAKELAEKSLKVKEGFLANMSHEIRTPMNGIISMIDMLAETPLDDEQYDYVETIRKSSETLLNILNDILDLSKIEAGKMKLRPNVVSLKAVLEKVHALFYQQARQKSIHFSYTLEGQLPEYVSMDETRFLQVLSNLVSNALKFTREDGSVSIRLLDVSENSAKLKPDEKMLRIEVEDTGIGISKEAQQALFQNFSQVDSSVTKQYGGTGLGLSISKQLSEMMGGNIGVKSEEKEGSTFWFSCKVKNASRPQQVKVSKTNNASQLLADLRPSVLLVDDNLVNRKVSGQILKKANCEVYLAESGAQAIALVQEHEFDVILMDIQMPEMDGVAATHAIKNLGLPRVPPIIAMTAYSMQGDKEKFVNAGLDDYVSKPIRPMTLIAKLAEVLQVQEKKGDSSSSDKIDQDLTIINFAILKDLEKYGGKEIIVDTLKDFQEEAAQLINSCVESFKVGDYDNILSKLHTLKGNATTLGIDRLASQVKRMEADLKDGRKTGLPEDLVQLEALFSEFDQEFKRFLNNINHG